MSDLHLHVVAVFARSEFAVVMPKTLQFADCLVFLLVYAVFNLAVVAWMLLLSSQMGGSGYVNSS